MQVLYQLSYSPIPFLNLLDLVSCCQDLNLSARDPGRPKIVDFPNSESKFSCNPTQIATDSDLDANN